MTPTSLAATLPGLNSSSQFLTATITEQVELARDTYRMRLNCPEIAANITPGQFFMIRSPGRNDPLLGRPFALYDVIKNEADEKTELDFGYAVIGKMTGLLSTLKPGDTLEIWGPLGNGFPQPTAGRLTCVAGGIGYTPFVAVAREALGLSTYGSRTPDEKASYASLLYGTRSIDYCADFSDLNFSNFDYKIATDDGSEGHHGFVTELLMQQIDSPERPDNVFCCGPVPMMKAVAGICKTASIPCWVSLETPMACGFGACFSCVTRVQLPDGTWDYRRTCVEGPVFPAEEVLL